MVKISLHVRRPLHVVCLHELACASSQNGGLRVANLYKVHGFNVGPSKPGRLCITFYDLPWEVAYHFCHSFLVNWSLRFGLDLKRGHRIHSLGGIHLFLGGQRNCRNVFQAAIIYAEDIFLVYTIDTPVRDTISLPLGFFMTCLFFPFFHNPLKMFTNERYQLHIFCLVLLRPVDRLILAPGPNISGCSVLLCLLPVWLTLFPVLFVEVVNFHLA